MLFPVSYALILGVYNDSMPVAGFDEIRKSSSTVDFNLLLFLTFIEQPLTIGQCCFMSIYYLPKTCQESSES